MSIKRSFPSDDVDVSNLIPSKAVTVHGLVVGQVSPIKTSEKNNATKYFEGKLTDRKKVVQLISFESKLKTDFEEAQQNQKEIALTSCTAKENNMTKEIELLLGARTQMMKSPKKFKIDDSLTLPLDPSSAEVDIVISDLNDTAIHQSVNINGKITALDPPQTIHSKGDKHLQKQDFRISDATGTCRGVCGSKKV